MEAKVPQRLPDAKGGYFDANKYNDKAMFKFQEMMKQGIDYDLLVKATILYYKSASSFKKKIANYILDGDWFTDYEMLRLSAEAGEEKLKKHIKDELNGGQHSPYGY
jgi:hypothetical protein